MMINVFVIAQITAYIRGHMMMIYWSMVDDDDDDNDKDKDKDDEDEVVPTMDEWCGLLL
jgi:hypothetical protein